MERRSTSILHDLPAEQDALDFKPYVAALTGIVSSPGTRTPLTVGVFGEWGSGKTSLMRMVMKKLPKKCCVAWFDAWKYEREEELWRAFLLQVLGALIGLMRTSTRSEGTLLLKTHRGRKEAVSACCVAAPLAAAAGAPAVRIAPGTTRTSDTGASGFGWWRLRSDSDLCELWSLRLWIFFVC